MRDTANHVFRAWTLKAPKFVAVFTISRCRHGLYGPLPALRRTLSRTVKFELGAKIMFQNSILRINDQGTAEERLWRAVITKSLEEWICGPLSFSRKAEQFLFHDNKDFKAVCSSAGMDPERLRKRLMKLRSRGIEKLNIPFRVRTNKRLAFPQNGSIGQSAFGV